MPPVSADRPVLSPSKSSRAGLSIALAIIWAVALHAAPQQWRVISDFDQHRRIWDPESGASDKVRITDTRAHSGTHSLAVTMVYANQGKSLRQTWGTDVSDLRWSANSRVRFWIRGSKLAQNPHGGIILVEAGGKEGGGDSHWILDIPASIYSATDWEQFTSDPLAQATNPSWAPDADAKPDPNRITRILFVAQQEAPPELNKLFTVYIDDVCASEVEPLQATFRDATIEREPDHITPIWRGFKGRPHKHPPQITFEDVTGWRVAQFGGARATMQRSREEPCHENLQYQAKVTYSSLDGTGHIELLPPEPIPIAKHLNAACAWVYGNNWAWVPKPDTPPVHIWLCIIDGRNQHHRIDLGVVNFRFYGWLSRRLRDDPAIDPGHLYWGGPADGRIYQPAAIEAIEIRGGTQPDPRTIYIESAAVYQDTMPLPDFRPELIEDLPFPNTPNTILPTIARPTDISVQRIGADYVFTARGDETVIWRYAPRTGTLSDLTVSVAGREPFKPCAGAGPVIDLNGTEREPTDPALHPELLSTRFHDGTVETDWQVSLNDDATQYTISLTVAGKSLIADWSSDGQRTTAFRLGRADNLDRPRIIRVPYLAIHDNGPAVALADDTFLSCLLDWYNTNCSTLYARCECGDDSAVVNGGSTYHRLTDGTRNPLRERLFINVSSRFEEVLPNIPNPPSTQRHVTSTHLYTHLGGTGKDRFQSWLNTWRQYHRKGIDNVMVTHHEDAWTNGADVGQGGQAYTMCTDAAPEIGDDQLIAYCRALREMGYHVGLYENFTDYNPLAKSWDERNCARNSYGELMRVWPPTYAIRPLKALEMALDYPRRVADKFGTNCAYRDCHTAYPPWGQVDYQAGSPLAGKLAQCFTAWGALLRDGHKAYNGPIFSEGGHHWFLAGLVDGNYAQIRIPNAPDRPLLLDFDLHKIHPLEADIAMSPSALWGPDGIWSGMAATIAYGHIGFLPVGDLTRAATYYYLMQQLQSRYVMIPAADIEYHEDGRFYGVTEALKNGAIEERQVRVTYENGLRVAVNYNPEKGWHIALGDRQFDLAGYSWAAVGHDFVEYCTEIGDRRIGYVNSPAYVFADAGGAVRDFGPIATDGPVVLRQMNGQPDRLEILGEATHVRLSGLAITRVEAFDANDERILPFDPQITATGVTIPTEGIDYYLLYKE